MSVRHVLRGLSCAQRGLSALVLLMTSSCSNSPKPPSSEGPNDVADSGVEAATCKFEDGIIEGDVEVNDAEALHALAGCKTVTGTLTIRATELEDLRELAHLTSVGGALIIRENAKLVGLNGLEGLTSVAALSVYDNDALTSLAALSSLTNVLASEDSEAGAYRDHNINIDGNDALTDLTGLDVPLIKISVRDNKQLQSLKGLSTAAAVNIEIFKNPSLASLSGLEQLESVQQLRIIGNTGLKSLDGLDGLSTAWTVEVRVNPALVSLRALTKLRVVRGVISEPSSFESPWTVFTGLAIHGNDALTDLAGLESLTEAGAVQIEANTRLESLNGLNALTSVSANFIDDYGQAGSLIIADNPALTSLRGVEALTFLSGRLKIDRNDSLTDMAGVDSLAKAGAVSILRNAKLETLNGLNALTLVSSDLPDGLDDFSLVILDNPNLANLEGLGALTSVESSLSISDNATLVSIAGLSVLNSVGSLDISDNPALAQCQVDALAVRVMDACDACTGNEGTESCL